MKRIFILTIVSGLWFLPALADAASMYIILDKTQVTQQGVFAGTVYVSTGGLPINNAESTIHFPADILSVDSVSTVGSIFNIWVEQPSFSNSAGTIYFNGGLPTPGYSGQSGNSLRINFRAKKTGTANLSFGSSAVRANDGNGTNVLTQTNGASISIIPASPVATPVTPAPTPILAGVPKAPIITSEDMPDQNAWYSKTEGIFSWELLPNISAVQLVLSRSPDTDPFVMYDPPIKSKTLLNLTEGTLYLNARFKNDIGWGRIGSRKIQVDTTAPMDLLVKTGVTDEDLIFIAVSAKDEISGIRGYAAFSGENKIAEQINPEPIAGIASANRTASVIGSDADNMVKFNLPPLSEEQSRLVVRAYDKAGNYTETDITVDMPETKAPKITHYPEYIRIGSKIEIRGKSPYTGADINLWFKEEGQEAKSYLVKPDEDRIFSYTSDPIETVGVVSVWAETIRGEDIKSEASEKVYIGVKETNFVWLGTRAIQTISIVVTLLVLLFGLLALIYSGIRKLNALKRKLRRELVHTEQEVHKVFKILKGDTKRHLKMLEKASTKRKLTKEESAIFTELSENLDETEKYLTEKIQSVEKEGL